MGTLSNISPPGPFLGLPKNTCFLIGMKILEILENPIFLYIGGPTGPILQLYPVGEIPVLYYNNTGADTSHGSGDCGLSSSPKWNL